jgi:hypothetical protein
MSMIIDPMNERSTTPDPGYTEHTGHHGSSLSSPWLAFGLLILVAAVILVVALVAA